MNPYKIITLLIFLSLNLKAQVKMYYEQYLSGQLDISDIAAIQVNNFTGVDIDYIYKGWATDNKGKEIMRIQSDVITQSRGSANYYQRGKTRGSKKTQVNFITIKRNIEISSFSGSLTFHSELVHPLDTTSIIAREEKEVILKNGKFVDANGEVIINPQLVNINFKHRFSQPFELEKLSAYFDVNNKMGFAICKPFNLKIKQEKRELYTATIDQFCVREGKNSLEKEQWLVIKNDYASRSLETPITVAFSFGPREENRTIQAVSHALYDDQMVNYKSDAMGVSFNFVNHAEILSTPSANNAVIIFDKKGSVEAIETLKPWRRDSPLGINHPYGFSVKRADVNGAVQLAVYDYNNFNEAEWKSFLAYRNRVDAKEIQITKASGIEIWYPPNLYHQRKESNRVVSYEIFTFAIRDGQRVTFVELLNVVPDSSLKDFPKPRHKIQKEAILDSLKYYGMNVSLKVGTNGNINGVDISNEAALADVNYRKRSLVKYIRYQQILDEKNQSRSRYRSIPTKVDFRELDSLANLKKMESLAIPEFQKITPDHDPVRKYAQFSWDSMQIAFTHRVSEQVDRIPFSNKLYESYTINNQDRIMSHYQSSGSKNISLQEGEREVAFLGNVLQLSTTLDQRITFTVIEKELLFPRDMKAITAYEMSNPIYGAPKVLKKEVDGWTFYVSESKVNPGRRMGQTNLFFLETEKYIYRVKISGGFKSDIPYFLNHLKIEGKQLQFDFDGDRLEKISTH